MQGDPRRHTRGGKTEEVYFSKTGLFPIMHLIGIRRSLAAANPWLPVNVYKALLKAKQIAMQDLARIDSLPVTHPWMAEETERVQSLMGEDFWRYGFRENSREIDAIVRYARNDGLINRSVEPQELFDASTFDEFRF